MAGGIDWFRWHHGSVTDPKFQLVARRAGASLPDVLAVWAYLLEKASAADFRGCFGGVDAESVDCLFGFDDGTAATILAHMSDRTLIADEYIVAWEKRQPKREREDDTAAERKRQQRERDTRRSSVAVEQTGVTTDDTPKMADTEQVTPRHATSHQKTPRGEESREEEKEEPPTPLRGSDAPTIPCPYQSVADLYHAELPSLPKVRLMPTSRQRAMRKAWGWILSSSRSDGSRRATTADEAIDWLREYFRRALANDFLMGRTQRSEAHAGWQCDLDFLLSDKGMKQVIERTTETA